MVQWSILEMHLLYHLNDGGIDHAEHQLRVKTEHEHYANGGKNQRAFGQAEIREFRPFLIERPVEDSLQNSQDENRGYEQPEDRQRRCPGAQRESAFENKDFSNEAVKAGKPEGRKQSNAHKATEDWSNFPQAAE